MAMGNSTFQFASTAMVRPLEAARMKHVSDLACEIALEGTAGFCDLGAMAVTRSNKMGQWQSRDPLREFVSIPSKDCKYSIMETHQFALSGLRFGHLMGMPFNSANKNHGRRL